MLKLVPATCSEQYAEGTLLFEPPVAGLPTGLLASPVLVRVVSGTVYLPLVNVGTTDVILYAGTVLRTLNSVQVVSLPAGITEVEPVRVLVHSEVVEMVNPVQEQIEAVDLSVLSQGEQGEFRALLKRYQSVFSAHDGDLGCTDLISHETPLLDSVPIHQRYRRIPVSEYEVKSHINQLLETNVIRESCSPYASRIVLARKEDVVYACALTTVN